MWEFETTLKYITEWVKENQYQICGKSFTTYYISPGNEANICIGIFSEN